MIKGVRINTEQLKEAILDGGLRSLEYKIGRKAIKNVEESFETALRYWGTPDKSRSRSGIKGNKDVTSKPLKHLTIAGGEQIELEVAVYNDILYFVSEGTKINYTGTNIGYRNATRFNSIEWGTRGGTINFIPGGLFRDGLEPRRLPKQIIEKFMDDLPEILKSL
jgi:hypothetical protein